MLGKKPKMLATPLGFLSRLARDVRGNALAIMAIALVPLAGLVGGGIDISRMYITKTRLQHACDAGALAGRKAMGGGAWSQSNGMPNTTAVQFFDANFAPNSYGTRNLTKAFAESAGKVTGTASVELQMTLVKVVTKDWAYATLSVTCDAEMRLPNTDIMFVLDNTGSMDQKAVSTDPDTKMESLRTAVKCFYEIVARLDTDANCTTGNPGTSGTGTQVQIRFGFVPYSTNVNVGRLLPNSYLADSWNYQTRVANWNPPGTTSNGPYWQVYSGGAISQSDCLKYMNNQSFGSFTPTATTSGGPSPTPTVVVTFNSDGTATAGGTGEWGWSGSSDDSGTNRSCRRARTDATTTYVPQFASWDYKDAPINISGLKAGGSSWNNTFTAPIGANGTDRTITWDGCIEERRPTVQATDYDPIPSGAKDLNIDLVPSSGDATTLWGPALPELIYMRSITSQYSQASRTNVLGTTTNYYNGVSYYCPTQAKKLQSWPDATTFDGYVDSLVPTGNTYHDIGMLWGARLMSPTGIFASENALTPGGAEIERHMIFMTDGDAVSQNCDYAAYGVAFWDQRTTTDVGTANDCAGINGGMTSLNNQINYRLEALCTAVKNKNITLWVISFGSGSNTTTESRLETCASPGRYFTARNSATLQTTFASIANQISQLRLTK
ncbi:MAG: TadE/TadG family type IV pilus assembly protein [Sphingomonas sp.]|jgi:Flp pilus assembly protein TadG|uniref:pilus assembly protein TadG-related protein n=1 Tax=Sphingomonas sp. TaxID=28214 RepID=UPI00356A6A21